ncbi:MAG: hypothetical protein IKQ00_13355 [Butyrivibrio sp.]|nr:hypothetical protein [Butyrivibrio sp.]
MAIDVEKRNKRQNAWIKENTDRINFMMPKGTKMLIRTAAENLGITSSEYIRIAIDEKLDNVKDKIHSETIPNAMDWLKNHGHTDSEIVDFLAHIKNGKI